MNPIVCGRCSEIGAVDAVDAVRLRTVPKRFASFDDNIAKQCFMIITWWTMVQFPDI